MSDYMSPYGFGPVTDLDRLLRDFIPAFDPENEKEDE